MSVESKSLLTLTRGTGSLGGMERRRLIPLVQLRKLLTAAICSIAFMALFSVHLHVVPLPKDKKFNDKISKVCNCFLDLFFGFCLSISLPFSSEFRVPVVIWVSSIFWKMLWSSGTVLFCTFFFPFKLCVCNKRYWVMNKFHYHCYFHYFVDLKNILSFTAMNQGSSELFMLFCSNISRVLLEFSLGNLDISVDSLVIEFSYFTASRYPKLDARGRSSPSIQSSTSYSQGFCTSYQQRLIADLVIWSVWMLRMWKIKFILIESCRILEIKIFITMSLPIPLALLQWVAYF